MLRFSENLRNYLTSQEPALDLRGHSLEIRDGMIHLLETERENPELSRIRDAALDALQQVIWQCQSEPALDRLRNRLHLIDHLIFAPYNEKLSLWARLTPENMPPNPVVYFLSSGGEMSDVDKLMQMRRKYLPTQ